MLVRVAAALCVLAFALGFAACGDDDESSRSDSTVTIGTASEVDLDEADPDATREPGGEEVLGELTELRRAEADLELPAIRGSGGLTVGQWLDVVNGDVASYWQRQFNIAGYRYRPARQLVFDKPVKTRCGGRVSPFEGPFYCELDQTIFLPLGFFVQEARRYGDAGPALIVAHENGHRVQDLLGIFDRPYRTIQTELQADCMAGIWAASIYRRGLFEEGDIGEILGEVRASGDGPTVSVNDPNAHGNANLRSRAFFKGYKSGKPGDCPVPRVPPQS